VYHAYAYCKQSVVHLFFKQYEKIQKKRIRF
jgi:hypothetical protein